MNVRVLKALNTKIEDTELIKGLAKHSPTVYDKRGCFGVKGVGVREVVRHLNELYDIPINCDSEFSPKNISGSGIASITLRMNGMTLAHILQAIEDQCLDVQDVQFVVRDYGIFATSGERARAQQWTTLAEFIKHGAGKVDPRAAKSSPQSHPGGETPVQRVASGDPHGSMVARVHKALNTKFEDTGPKADWAGASQQASRENGFKVKDMPCDDLVERLSEQYQIPMTNDCPSISISLRLEGLTLAEILQFIEDEYGGGVQFAVRDYGIRAVTTMTANNKQWPSAIGFAKTPFAPGTSEIDVPSTVPTAPATTYVPPANTNGPVAPASSYVPAANGYAVPANPNGYSTPATAPYPQPQAVPAAPVNPPGQGDKSAPRPLPPSPR